MDWKNINIALSLKITLKLHSTVSFT
jgi:hypothetical protein